MCVCIPAAAPFFLPLLEILWLILSILGPLVVPAVTVLLGALFLTVRGLVALVAWPVREFLENRELRLHNERMAQLHPHLRAELPAAGRRRVDVSVVRPQPAALDAVPLAIEAARPQLMPPSVRMYATPRKELTR